MWIFSSVPKIFADENLQVTSDNLLCYEGGIIFFIVQPWSYVVSSLKPKSQ